ncbi:MAG: hypothetical protein ACTHJ5_10480 [Ilyomonas sp.]
MIQFNLIARVADDKNYFVDFIHVVHQAKNLYNIDVQFTFVGAIQNEGLYKALARMAEVLKVDHLIDFTKASVRYDDLPGDLKKGYFLNFSVGNSIGYSSIESIKYNFKTLFYNVDPKCVAVMQPGLLSFCKNYNDLLEIIKMIEADKVGFDEQLERENKALLPGFSLTKKEADLLITTMI